MNKLHEFLVDELQATAGIYEASVLISEVRLCSEVRIPRIFAAESGAPARDTCYIINDTLVC